MGVTVSTQSYGNRGLNVARYPTQQQQQQHHNVQGAQSFSSGNRGWPQQAAPAMQGGGHSGGHHIVVQGAPTSSSAAPSAPSADTNKNVAPTSMDKQTILRYVQMEKEINRLESMNVVEHLQIRWDELKGLEEEMKRLTSILQTRKEQTMKEKKDVDDMQEPSVRSFFADQRAFDERMSREQEEYLAALNKQEVAQKELDAAAAVHESAKVAVKELHVHAEQLQKLYKEQDALLATIFDGKYGSDLEFRLEREHDAMSDRQQRIAAAKARWQAGRLLIHHACSQLGHAMKQWQSAASVPLQHMQQRYTIATEVRNYLIAACTNLRNSQNYLKGIDFPYCKPEEVNTTDRAANNIFTDVATNERHQHAMNVYRAMFQRSGALLQWFDTVIDRTIDKDLLSATEELFAKKRQLRVERVRLIKEKLTELVGPEEAASAGLDEDANLTDARRLQEQMENVNQEELQKLMKNVKVTLPEVQAQAGDAAAAAAAVSAEPSRYSVEDSAAVATASKGKRKKKKGKKQKDEEESGQRSDDEAQEGAGGSRQEEDTEERPAPPSRMATMPKIDVVSLKDLAPPPSQEQLFGDIDSIKKQYEIDMEEYQRAQDINRARVEQGLQEKLAARKSRKARKMAQEQETEKLLHESGTA